ncbi:MAG: PilZ domain-containing protein, partial [bacterium]
MVTRGSSGAEKRRHERIPVKVSSWLSPAERATAGGRGVLVDISLGGCRVETRFVDHGSKYRPGDTVLVRFPVGEGGIELSGSLMWIRPVGTLDVIFDAAIRDVNPTAVGFIEHVELNSRFSAGGDVLPEPEMQFPADGFA